jgi:hypothetical protein
LSRFSWHLTGLFKHKSICKVCTSVRAILRRKERGDAAIYQRTDRKRNPNKYKSYDLQRLCGLTIQQKEQMLIEQSFCCKLCNKQLNMITACVDHNHRTGKIRGLLCQKCNRHLGIVEKNPIFVQNALEYLHMSDNKGVYTWL